MAAKWDATSQTQNPNAFVIASKVDQAGAPTGSQDIDWVSLRGTTGQLAKQVYRTNTQLGQPPANVTLYFVNYHGQEILNKFFVNSVLLALQKLKSNMLLYTVRFHFHLLGYNVLKVFATDFFDSTIIDGTENE